MATSDMPLANETSVINYLRNMLGVSSNGVATASNVGTTQQAVAGTATAGTATVGQAAELTQDQLSTIMTEWFRGNGQFLDNMRQQNISGLYNSSTQRLVANDLTAQAALKAATANQDIQKTNAALATNASVANANNATSASSTNAQLATNASATNANVAAQGAQTNAKLATEASLANAKSGVTTSRSDALINTALAGLLNAYKGYTAQSAKDEAAKKKQQAALAGVDTSGITDTSYGDAAGAMFNYNTQAAQADTNFLVDPNYQNSTIITDPSYDFGSSMMQPAASSFDIPYSSPIDMGSFTTPTVMDFGQTTPQQTYDFSPVDISGSDYYTTGAGSNLDYSGSGDSWTPVSGDGGSDSSFTPAFSADDDEFNIGFSWSF